ncbi:MAG: sel1 repeat family protein [Bacteroidaceae bacterium]|nr:sel1 repeat family protein [Bacteroidaceae bacterium]
MDELLRQANQYLDQGDYTQAFNLFSQAAETGNAGAIRSLASLYETGWGVEQSDAKALELYQKARTLGDKYAQYSEAKILLESETVPHDPEAALQLLEPLADDAEFDDVPTYLVALYLSDNKHPDRVKKGWGILKKVVSAGNEAAAMMMQHIPLPTLQLLADQGDADALSILAHRYMTGSGVTLDIRRAFSTYGASAEAGSSMAMVHLARMYELGEGTKHDYAKALQWYERAAEAGVDCSEHVERLRKVVEQTPESKAGCLPVILAVAMVVGYQLFRLF